MSKISSQGQRALRDPLQEAVKTDPVAAARMLHDGFDSAVRNGAAGSTAGLDCRAGCSHCCYQLVSVRAPEIFRLARAIRQLAPEQAAAIARNIAETDRVTRGRSVAERAQDHVACPLLGADGGCLLYEERPLNCRVFASLDVKACRRLFAGLGSGVPTPPGRMQAGGALIAAFDRASNAVHVDSQPYEMVAGLAITLGVADAEAAWMKGRDVLAAARRQTRTLGRQTGATVRF